MYANGRGISRDESQAVFWYRRAARAGYHDAIEELKRRHLSP
jgi:TPR repeat protein